MTRTDRALRLFESGLRLTSPELALLLDLSRSDATDVLRALSRRGSIVREAGAAPRYRLVPPGQGPEARTIVAQAKAVSPVSVWDLGRRSALP